MPYSSTPMCSQAECDRLTAAAYASVNPAPMSDYDAVAYAEGFQDCDDETRLAAWQHLIDTGLAWRLQGSFGRTAATLINSGMCHAAE